ncbi:hypothetical protein N0V90_005418 [Kalmusia sp. IMI 367209]|nr:hypothetical protein N0V90_005418 [Kalmusia sp. IMI 367209]
MPLVKRPASDTLESDKTKKVKTMLEHASATVKYLGETLKTVKKLEEEKAGLQKTVKRKDEGIKMFLRDKEKYYFWWRTRDSEVDELTAVMNAKYKTIADLKQDLDTYNKIREMVEANNTKEKQGIGVMHDS